LDNNKIGGGLYGPLAGINSLIERSVVMIDLLTYMVGTVAAIGFALLVYLVFQIYSSDTYTREE